MTHKISRRSVLAGGAALLSMSAMARSALAQEARLRVLWWGSQARADRTNKVNQLFQEQNAGVAINGEFLGWSDYWPRLATQVAGRNAPDIIQMDYRYIVEYARRGALAPLDDYLGSVLEVEDFDQVQIKGGSVDGKLYGITLGANSAAMMVNAAAFEEAGVDLPSPSTTWEEMAKIGAEITQAGKRKGFYGLSDGSAVEPLLENWLRQRGKALFTAEGKIGYDANDAAEWFTMWQNMREAKACVPPDVQALDQYTVETSPLSLGKSAASFAHSNQFVAYQGVSKDKLALRSHPLISKDSKGGHYRKPSMFFSVAAQTKDPELGAKYVNFFVKDPKAAEILGVERGVPESSAVREALAPTLDELGRAMLDYVSGLGPLAGELPPPPPSGAGEAEFALRNVAEQVGFGQLDAKQGGETLVNEVSQILARG
ncbi:extracellular solute-binding protein [Sinorhizobium medicae]|uniref:ABC transporter substrate-binding protein n=1 Tax=Sinorhizobium medicae TaxID=110321 RepID=UPI000418076F|nr:ABC transporter substrate-binding protein [Sinorhizobium medicae]MBO1940973.1 carbohydrate ABC transporter substrate-binding protein [Sinorhizobium medicae]MDX0430613.1 extracellular solute-binding protein [Sinorhizobium medicae]MDX0442989.1 extracellular solute-binding protein [Sinorhizobium medicae]MDX0460507.1 extracellular solute-binding protein [Sinorhizobium medicae]MDX0484251.1 extracellular solute-binding protein [Sinorhizobium medicae]